MASLRTALIAAIVFSAAPVLAQNPPSTMVRATIESVGADGASVAVRTRAGEDRTIRLGPKTRITFVVPATLADVKPGAFIGVAALPGEGGELEAMEVHIFPEAMRGTGEGFRPFDLAPRSTMTNGAIAARVEGAAGPKLTVSYKGGQQTIVVGPNDPDRRLRARRPERPQARRGDDRARRQAGRRLGRGRLRSDRQGRARAADVRRRTARVRLPDSRLGICRIGPPVLAVAHSFI